MTAGEISHPLRALRPRGGPIQFPQTRPSKPPAPLPETPTPSKSSLPVWTLAVIQPMTPLHGFAGMTACLQTQEPFGNGLWGTPQHPVHWSGVTPRISIISMSHMMRDEVIGVTYMDTVTTSIGRVALSGPDPEASSQGLTIEDVTNCV